MDMIGAEVHTVAVVEDIHMAVVEDIRMEVVENIHRVVVDIHMETFGT